ncbi:hypothetical protein D3C87_1331360 [compost metagenome]
MPRRDSADLKNNDVIQDGKILNIASSPKCDIVVILPSMKSYPCKENPQVISVPIVSERIEIKKAGYIQKIIQLKKDQVNENISVILDSI